MPIWRSLLRLEPPMTIALLIALAGSLVAMSFIVKRLDQR
ncbi:putative membrane protein [Synechococcus sp. WH 8103]|jgi:hypothetical protein|nr:hypothetical protein SynRS9915_00863 [Synechococcus sp. RS9915]QNI91193.1 hypothetical protein SynBOUM118_00827 [Synechococcus sp. BOUM118]QNJ13490.1 hypothetical protein SynA18461_00840 [Synechococcus sp. A18-46.1]CRY91615.1 putative membrane protein [Synechococcus sp. WH 8103]